ncbi:hypothetical protein DFH09DRAFT_1394686 [Mycena vulgaris]|nr:hypothetical protein DFH09DRAFT_1394686 [Mycena vulgaris]
MTLGSLPKMLLAYGMTLLILPRQILRPVQLTGKKYEDLINILGLSAAGYVPQLFSIVFPNPEVIWDLLSMSNAKALILDVAFASNAANSPVPTSAALKLADLLLLKDFDTHYLSQGPLDGTNVANTIGTLAHVASLACMSTKELMRMVKTCGLNRMATYATFLSVYIKAAQTDPEVLMALQSFRQIVHAGVALNREDEEWAYAHNLPITAMYTTSETAKFGSDASDRLLRLIQGGSARLILYALVENEKMPASSSPQLWEMG